VDYGGRCDFSIIHEIEWVSDGHTRVIALSDSEDIANAALCFYQGGWGYELKNCGEDETDMAIRRVVKGYHFVCTALGGDFLLDAVLATPPLNPDLLKKLTPKERSVLAILKR
jgi:DNA-binding NarL/FixJ family response regulator